MGIGNLLLAGWMYQCNHGLCMCVSRRMIGVPQFLVFLLSFLVAYCSALDAPCGRTVIVIFFRSFVIPYICIIPIVPIPNTLRLLYCYVLYPTIL